MPKSHSHTPSWEAWPKNDRLKRWCVVDTAAPGTGKPVIADNIRQEAQARRIAASLDMLDALRDCMQEMPTTCHAWRQARAVLTKAESAA